MIRLALSMWWRVILVHMAGATVVTLLFAPLLSSVEPTYLKLKPTVFHATIGFALLLSLGVSRCGLLYLVLGRRLNQASAFWRQFTFALAALLFCLAVANLVVAYGVSTSVWVSYKAFVPAFALLLFCFAAVRMSSSAGLKQAKAVQDAEI